MTTNPENPTFNDNPELHPVAEGYLPLDETPHTTSAEEAEHDWARHADAPSHPVQPVSEAGEAYSADPNFSTEDTFRAEPDPSGPIADPVADRSDFAAAGDGAAEDLYSDEITNGVSEDRGASDASLPVADEAVYARDEESGIDIGREERTEHVADFPDGGEPFDGTGPNPVVANEGLIESEPIYNENLVSGSSAVTDDRDYSNEVDEPVHDRRVHDEDEGFLEEAVEKSSLPQNVKDTLTADVGTAFKRMFHKE